MTVLASSRDVAWHEAYHAGALCLAGLPPEVARIDWPTDGVYGHVRIDWGPDGATPEKAEAVLIAVLLGGTMDGWEGWDWPLDPDRVSAGVRNDAAQASHLADYLKLDLVGWAHVRWKAGRLTRDPRFRRLVQRIAHEFERREVLDADDLRKPMEETKCNT